MTNKKLVDYVLERLDKTLKDLANDGLDKIITVSIGSLFFEIQQATKLLQNQLARDCSSAKIPFIYANQPQQWQNLWKANCEAMLVMLKRYDCETELNEIILKNLFEHAIKFLNFLNDYLSIKNFPAFSHRHQLRLGPLLNSPAEKTFSPSLS